MPKGEDFVKNIVKINMTHIPQKGAAKWQATYLTKNPWAKHKMYAQSRAKRIGTPFNITVADTKHAWMRDEAHKLKHPSIDRVITKLGYIPSNIRFMEKSENTARAHRGRKSTFAQREAGRKNLTGWRNKKKQS